MCLPLIKLPGLTDGDVVHYFDVLLTVIVAALSHPVTITTFIVEWFIALETIAINNIIFILRPFYAADVFIV